MDNKLHFSDGYKVIAEAKKDPSSVQLFECDGTYYVMTEDVEDYMCASMNTEISDAIADIAKANGVDSQTICCVGSFDEDFLPEIDDEDEDSIPDEDEEDDILEPSEEVEEGFSFKKRSSRGKKPKLEANKKYNYTKEELDEIKNIKDQIKKVAPAIIKKYNNDKEALKTLSDSIDLLDDDKLKAKFEFAIDDETNHSIYIWVFGKEVGNRITKLYNSGEDFDYHFDKWTRKIVADIADDIKKELPSTELIKMTVDPETLAGEIMFDFIPKSATNESAESLYEAAAATKAYNLSWKYKTALKSNSVFDDIEQDKGISIDNEVKEFIKKTNGATPDKTTFKVGKEERVYGATVSFNKGDKDNIYSAMNAIKNNDLLPIVADPFGNYVCYNVKNSSIVFWDHETDKVSKVSNSLSSFLSSLYNTDQTNESVESLDEAYEMLLEKSVEDGAMTLKQAEKTYNKILKTCKSEAETEKQLDDCIKTLNKCIDNMKAEKKKVEDGMKSKDQIKYSLKALIPFNSVYRMIKRNDWNIAGIAGDIANLFGAGRCLYITKKKL